MAFPAPVTRVHSGSFLTLHYRLAGADGSVVVDTFGAKPATLSLGRGQLAPAMESRLIGLEEGAHAVFHLPAGEAFGERNPALVQRIARRLVDDAGDAEVRHAVGDVLSLSAPDGRSSIAGTVREVGDDWLLVDFNHPLAGRAVTFEVELVGVL